MIPNGSVKIGCAGIGYQIEGELGKFIDCAGFYMDQQLETSLQLGQEKFLPSLGSATANDAFFSSLIESSSVANRGVTFPSTNAAVCSKAVLVSTRYFSRGRETV